MRSCEASCNWKQRSPYLVLAPCRVPPRCSEAVEKHFVITVTGPHALDCPTSVFFCLSLLLSVQSPTAFASLAMAQPNINIAFSPGRLNLHRYVQEREAKERADERRHLEKERLAREKTLESAVLSEYYKYQRIQDYHGSRVLVLQPGDKADLKLSGRLEDLWMIGGHSESYMALSYVWGEPNFTDVILIEGKRLAITNSLGAALRRLRPPAGHPPLRIWVDQICINQRDTVERNNQVRLMHAIFRDASRVLVWLGTDSEGHAARAFQIANALRSIFDDKLLASLCKAKGANFDWIPAENWKSLRELSKLQWFRRAWIPQEIGTEADAVVHWGAESIGWEILHDAMKKLEVQGWELRKKYKIDTSSVTLLFRRFVEQPPDAKGWIAQHSFIYQLCLSARNTATDPRDYVFSQLGHYSAWIEPEEALIIQPDYDNSVAAVYHEIAIRALSVDDTLMLLNAVSDNGETRPPLPGSKLLPSWVPRWDAGRFHSLIGHPGRYRASGATKSWITKDSFEDNYETLVVKGLVVDTIDKITPRFTSSCFNPESSKKDLIQAAWRLCRPPKPTAAAQPSPSSISRPGSAPPSSKSDSVKFTTQGAYQNDASFPLLKAFLDALAPAALYSHLTSSSKMGADSAAYISGIAALAKLFSPTVFSSKHDPRKSPSPSPVPADEPEVRSSRPNPTAWLQAAEDHAVHRCFAVTREARYLAVVPPTAKVGDMVCILQGGETPYVLRVDKSKGDERRVFVGEAYVPGLMDDASGLFGRGVELGTLRLR